MRAVLSHEIQVSNGVERRRRQWLYEVLHAYIYNYALRSKADGVDVLLCHRHMNSESQY